MIISRIGSGFLRRLYTQGQHFCTQKMGQASKMFVKNDNLAFEDSQYKLNTYFFLPEMIKTVQGAYQISNKSNVLSFVWERKQKREAAGSNAEQEKSKQGQEKFSFSFKYAQLHPLLEVLPNSNATVTMERKKSTTSSQIHQYLTLIDNPQQKYIHYNYENILSDGQRQKITTIKFKFAYSQHRIFEILLRRSMFDLSGMSLIYELKREQELNSAENQGLRTKQLIEKEVKDFYK